MVAVPRRVLVLSALVLLLCLLLLSCEGARGGLRGLLASPTPSVPPTATATATPSPTATATATPLPTATPTATPLPPPSVALVVQPASPAQGQTVVVRVSLGRAATVSGDFDGQPLTFLYDSPTEAWALVGVPPWSALGERPLAVEVVAPEGAVARASQPVAVRATAFELQAIDVSPEQEFLLATGLRPTEDAYLAATLQPMSPLRLWDGPFGIPAEGIRTSPYGAQRAYAGGPVTSYHGGLDFAAPEGTGVFAPAAGVVVMAEPLYVRGNTIILDHGAGVYSLYFHLSQSNVVPGQRVERGELIGLIGTTGLSTGAHLHWEVRIGAVFVDPDEWVARSFP